MVSRRPPPPPVRERLETHEELAEHFGKAWVLPMRQNFLCGQSQQRWNCPTYVSAAGEICENCISGMRRRQAELDAGAPREASDPKRPRSAAERVALRGPDPAQDLRPRPCSFRCGREVSIEGLRRG